MHFVWEVGGLDCSLVWRGFHAKIETMIRQRERAGNQGKDRKERREIKSGLMMTWMIHDDK